MQDGWRRLLSEGKVTFTECHSAGPRVVLGPCFSHQATHTASVTRTFSDPESLAKWCENDFCCDSPSVTRPWPLSTAWEKPPVVSTLMVQRRLPGHFLASRPVWEQLGELRSHRWRVATPVPLLTDGCVAGLPCGPRCLKLV